MKVSIIIPVYNAESFLDECMSSIEQQTYKDIEAIFVNDCSTDGSLQKLCGFQESYKTPIRISNNPQNRGTAYSRNAGIKTAQGEYIYFMDDDDTITPDCIEKLVSTAIQHHLPDIVCADVDCKGYYYNKPKAVKYIHNNKDIRASYFSHEWYEMPWNKLIRKEYIISNSIYFTEGIYNEDTLWSFQTALTANSIVLLPELTYFFRVSDSQKTARKDNEKNTRDKTICLTEMYHSARKSPDNESALLYLTDICTGYLLAIIRNKNLPSTLKKQTYNSLRSQCNITEALQGLKSDYLSRGVKLMLLYRLLPAPLGRCYLTLFSKIAR